MKKQPPLSRSLAKRAAVYILMTLAVIFFSTVLLFFLLGYRFNRDDGTFEQGGLVQFISRPTGAKITIGTAKLTNTSNTKITVNPGNYTVTMEKAGYHAWQKRVTVEAGKVLWLNSVHFVPTAPVTTSLFTLPATLGSTAARQDSEYFAYIADPTKAELRLVKINETSPSTRTILLDGDAYSSAKKHAFSVKEIFGDDRYFLLRHAYDASSEWVMVDGNDQTKTRVLGGNDAANVQQVYENPRDQNAVFLLYSDGSVRSQNLDSGSLSDRLLTGIETMSVSDQGTILYSKRVAKTTVETGYLSAGVTMPRFLERYTTKAQVHLSSGQYYGDFYITVVHDKTMIVTKYDDFPRSDDQASVKSTPIKTIDSKDTFTETEMRNDGRFAFGRQAGSLVTYDLQTVQTSTTPLYKVRSSSQPLMWLDDYHFFTDASGQLRQYEYDGTNQTDVVSVAPGFAAAYSNDLEYLFSVVKDAEGYRLQRTSMIVE